MKAAYRVLAYVIAAEVVIQAAMIAYALFGESKYIEEGGTINKQIIESESAWFDGVLGFIVHGINGQLVVPALALILLIVSFFAKVPKGVQWAGIVAGLVVLQVLMGIFGHAVPFIGLLHGLNALVLFACAVIAARLVTTATSAPVADRTSVA